MSNEFINRPNNRMIEMGKKEGKFKYKHPDWKLQKKLFEKKVFKSFF